MTEHTLKTWPAYFSAVADGTKRFEVRSTKDRTFAVGDVLVLREWDPATETYTGWRAWVAVTFVVEGAPFLPEGTAVLSIATAHRWTPGGAESNGVDRCERCRLPRDKVRRDTPRGEQLFQCVQADGR